MSNPSPLIPQGTFQAHANKGASNVRIAVATIVAIHIVFFGGLLLQGCKRDTKTGGTMTAETNPAVSDLTLPPRESAPLYYSNVNNLPLDTSALATSAPAAAADTSGYTASTTSTGRETFASSSYGSPQPVTPPASAFGGLEMPATTATTEYTVVRGDTYSHIAVAKGVTVEALKAANPGVEPRKIRPGMTLQVPAPTPATSTSATSGRTSSESSVGSDMYSVKAGDNLTRIAKAHGVTVSQLRAANNLKTSSLRVGQKLKIPSAGAKQTNGSGAPSF